MPSLSIGWVRHALGLPPTPADARSPVTLESVQTDSRRATAGTLFVAIPGEKFDGHDFVAAARAQGAAGAIVRRGTPLPSGPGPFEMLEVPENLGDTVTAYRRLAQAWRREFQVPVVVVAGSVGKTTTKELLAAILRGKWPEVLSTRGSQNGFLGIPMTLLELRPSHGAAVVEVGIDEPGAMDPHMALVEGTAAVLTSIAPEHLEKLIDLPTVAREESIALRRVAARGGTVGISLDDPWVAHLASDIQSGRKITYSLAGEGHLRGQYNERTGEVTVRGLGPGPVSFALPLPGRHNAGNLLAALAMAHALDLTPAQMREGLATFRGAEGRSELKFLPDGDGGRTPVICDYYNANPSSMESGLAMLSDVARRHGSTRRFACLGDMLELGPEELSFHRGLAGAIEKFGVREVLLYGPRMKALRDELRARGFEGSVTHSESHAELARQLRAQAGPGDAILIKGSRGMKMEEIWKAIAPKS